MFKKKSNWIPIYNYQYAYSNYLVQARIDGDGLISFKTAKITEKDGNYRNLGLDPTTQFQQLIKQNEK